MSIVRHTGDLGSDWRSLHPAGLHYFTNRISSFTQTGKPVQTAFGFGIDCTAVIEILVHSDLRVDQNVLFVEQLDDPAI